MKRKGVINIISIGIERQREGEDNGINVIAASIMAALAA